MGNRLNKHGLAWDVRTKLVSLANSEQSFSVYAKSNRTQKTRL